MSNIGAFNIRLEFGPDGEAAHAFYWDQEGCGHERILNPQTALYDVIAYHLLHYAKSHRMTPPKRCPFVLADTDGGRWHCKREPHKTGSHILEVDKP